MNKESRNFVPIVAALITGGATLTAALIANWDKLFPKPPDVTTEITVAADPAPSTSTTATTRPTQTPNTPTPTPVVSPTLGPLTPPLPSSPEDVRQEAQLDGWYDFVGQNFEPRPSRSEMLIRSVGGGGYSWESRGVFNGQLIRSRGRLRREEDGGWVGSIEESDDRSILTQGIPTELTFDGATLTVRNMRDGGIISWRRR